MSGPASKPAFNLFSVVTWFSAISSVLALATYAYLGTFTRHLADDYCSVHLIRGNFFVNLWQNYLTISDRFANFILISLSEAIWPRSVAILPALMLVFWVAGLAWLLHEASLLAGKGWTRPVALTLSLFLVFYAILLAPNPYQTLYWRASVAAHLAPLVFMSCLASFLLHIIRAAVQTPPAWWVYPLSFFLAFFVGDFSEPTDAIQIVLLGLAFITVWLGMKRPARRVTLSLLGGTLAGALTALLVMAISPANAFRLGSPPPTLLILISRSLRYAYEFILDLMKVRPLPSFLSVLVPFLLFYSQYAQPAPALARFNRNRILITLAIVPVLAYLLIVASFTPSVYGQGFPLERARFAGEFCLVAALMIEGAGLGVLLAQWRPRVFEKVPPKLISVALFGLLALYPLRIAWMSLAEVPAYRERAEAWDQRDAQIRELKAQGETDLLIPQFDGVYGIKELDVDPKHWANRCAAEYYDVNSIRAIPPDGP